MSIFSVNKAAKNRALTYQAMQVGIQDEQRVVDFGRQLLQNIRQERLAQSQLDFYNQIEGASTSSAKGAVANVQSGLAGEVEYAYRTGQRMDTAARYAQLEQDEWERYAKSVKRAQTNATIAVAAAGVAGGFLLAPVAGAAAAGLGATISSGTASAIGATAGAVLGAGAVSAIGDNSIAGNAAWSQALKSSASAWTAAAFKDLLTAKQTADVAQTAETVAETSYSSATGMGALQGWNGIPLSSLQNSYGVW